jgi:hypothetical protein
MKILYHHRIASKDGQFVHIEELTHSLKKRGHELIIVGPAVVESDQFGGEGGLVAKLKRYLPKFVIDWSNFGAVPDADAAKARFGLSGRVVPGFTGFVRERLAREARATIERDGYTWDRNAERVEQLFVALGVRGAAKS